MILYNVGGNIFFIINRSFFFGFSVFGSISINTEAYLYLKEVLDKNRMGKLGGLSPFIELVITTTGHKIIK